MNAEVIDSNRFGPYGEPLDPVAKNARLTNSPFGYTGEAHDIEARLVYLRARYYEPGTMQFLQQDSYWNPNNMIYGAGENIVGQVKIPDIELVLVVQSKIRSGMTTLGSNTSRVIGLTE